MQTICLVFFLFISLSQSAKGASNGKKFTFSGQFDDVPPDSCSGLISTVSLTKPVSIITCGAQCITTLACGRYFYEDVGNGNINCTLAEKFVDWQPTVGSTKMLYSMECNDSIAVSTPNDCKVLRAAGNTCSGYYTIYPDTVTPINVYCDMQTDQGGWTVIQRRFSGDVDFHTTWSAYRDGFGTNADYWLGNRWIHQMTNTGTVELYIKLEDWSCNRRFARYDNFSISSEADKFRLSLSGFSGDVGDSLLYNSGEQFSTKDADNDSHGSHCAVDHHRGGWWFGGCSNSDLNGLLYSTQTHDAKSMHWLAFHGWNSLKSSIMMIRRK